MIYLSAEVVSGLGEDTFWTWFNREFKNSSTFSKYNSVNKNDIILQYSTLGASKFPNNTVALLWELYPNMKERLATNQYDLIINNIMNCGRNAVRRVVASKLMVNYYKDLGKIDVLPIGVDTEIFKPLDKVSMRNKYGIPLNKKVGIWGGTNHKMKGFNRLTEWNSHKNEDFFWIIVWKCNEEKDREDLLQLDKVKYFTKIHQQQLAELFSCADFYLSSGLLDPYYMIEWEAMASNLKIIQSDLNMKKDFTPSLNPREDVFRLKWDRKTAKITWENYLNKTIFENVKIK